MEDGLLSKKQIQEIVGFPIEAIVNEMKYFLLLLIIISVIACRQSDSNLSNDRNNFDGAALNLICVQKNNIAGLSPLLNKMVDHYKDSLGGTLYKLSAIRKSFSNCLDSMIKVLYSENFGNLIYETNYEFRNSFAPHLAEEFWSSSRWKIHCNFSGESNYEIFQAGLTQFAEFGNDQFVVPAKIRDKRTFNSKIEWHNSPNLNPFVPLTDKKHAKFEDFVFENITIEESILLCFSMKFSMISWELGIYSDAIFSSRN